MIYCCCAEARELCDDSCCRWRGTTGPDHVVRVPQWKKTGAKPTLLGRVEPNKEEGR